MQDWSRLACKCCHARGTKVSKIPRVPSWWPLVDHTILSFLKTNTDFVTFQGRRPDAVSAARSDGGV